MGISLSSRGGDGKWNNRHVADAYRGTNDCNAFAGHSVHMMSMVHFPRSGL
jgi:hypothetical protein